IRGGSFGFGGLYSTVARPSARHGPSALLTARRMSFGPGDSGKRGRVTRQVVPPAPPTRAATSATGYSWPLPSTRVSSDADSTSATTSARGWSPGGETLTDATWGGRR